MLATSPLPSLQTFFSLLLQMLWAHLVKNEVCSFNEEFV